MIDVLFLPGTGHPNGGDGVTEEFLRHLDKKRFRPRIVRYPAEFGFQGAAYADSRAAGRQALITAIRQTDNLVVLGGYSQGAVIAGDLADEISEGLHPELEVLACALIADGRRPAGTATPGRGDRPPRGYGIVDQRTVGYRVPTWWAAAEGDPITALPAGNPLRTVADLAEWFSLRSPADAQRWGADMLDKIIRGRLQPWWSPQRWRDWNGALAYARGYLYDGRHGLDYVRYGHCHDLAMQINMEVREW